MKIQMVRVSGTPLRDRLPGTVGKRRTASAAPGELGSAGAKVKPDRSTHVRLDADAASATARQVAEIIRQRRDTGFYHRGEVLHVVTERLLQSGDLERGEM